MWFRNLRVYTLSPEFKLPETLADDLTLQQFTPCGRQELASFGWVSPFGRDSEVLVHKIGDSLLMCARKEEKVLPAAVIQSELEEHLERIEAEQGRKVAGKEKQSLKEDIIARLLPQAFTKYRDYWLLINTALGVVVSDAANASRAEDILALLRSSIGSLPVKPWLAEQPAEVYFTEWLQAGKVAADFEFGDELELRDSDSEGGIVRCKQTDLAGVEIKTHLEHGKQATKIGLIWADKLEFVLENDFAIKRFKPTDLLVENQDKLVDASYADKIDADFALLSGEFSQLFPALHQLFE
ncbi:recombination-associated protein RdgC [Pseudidiomarina taiwanensis]|uniref:Recombination-associated protein RdgC n=1 Tax=Pseudidiomarina taiwanensis TaxID=337250 RepID=A0A432ZCI4_9GAMM|nr:recombination-associated protein RdgC [Pseudidiomarina taiwanensis]RUO75665.1 recombination-associated protein RdgC [Pseudidiomarina taiwanensis]